MVDISNFANSIQAARNAAKSYANECSDPRSAFIDELRSLGFEPPANISPGRIERFPAPNEKRHKKSAWAIYYEIADSRNEGGCIGIGVYGDFKGSVEKATWCSRQVGEMTTHERLDYYAKLEAAKAQRKYEEEKKHQNAAQTALDIWSKADYIKDAGAYHDKKQITPSDGIKVKYDKFKAGELIIPISDESGLISLQFIANDDEYKINGESIGNKKMLSGGRKQGGYFIIKGNNHTVRIAEGYATGRSINMASGDTVYVCFDSGNIYEVTSAAKKQNPNAKIIICADDDQFNEYNAGRKKSMQAADGLGVEVVFPEFSNLQDKPTDFNDLHCREGLELLAKQLQPKLELYKEPEKEKEKEADKDLFNPPGMLGDIVSYYNATSGSKQPLFAVQTAIATASIMLARNFETNLSNRASLFLMNIAKSGTGKEHAKKTMEKILDACDLGHLISGDGYTAGSAVLSALHERPRHVTVIDEFSKYLQAAQNKYGSSHLMEANAQLMQAIGRLDGTMRPRAYSTIGLAKDKKKELADMRVINPAITLLTMTTPDDLFNTIDVSSIKDGFLNRFIVCVSDAKREIRQHKEPIDVPKNIINWSDSIRARHGDQEETAMDEPEIVKISYSDGALKSQMKFEQFCIDKCDELERFGMEEIPGRSNEMAMRLSLIVALSCNPQATIIECDHMEWAIGWVKHNLLILIERLKMSISSSEHEANKKEILKALRSRGSKGVTWASMQKQSPFSKHKAKDLKDIIVALIDADLIIEESNSNGSRGRPVKTYKALA